MTIGELVRQLESNYISGKTVISKHVQVSQKDTLDKVDAYLNSKHTTGETDSMGRDKPFFNIVTAAVNIWYRATDIDRKNIKVRTTRTNQDVEAFYATQKLQDWMRREDFGTYLNKWGRTLAKYGSAVSKFVEQDGKLHKLVVPWSTIICDTINFESNPVIEKLYLTPAELRKRAYDQDMVDKLLDAQAPRKTMDGQSVDTRSAYIEVYEIHGELPLSYLTDKDKDDDTFVQQMHVISFTASKEKGKFDDYTLASGKEKQSPYQKDDLIEEDGQTLSIGAVQNLFEAQWMINHSIKAIKDQLDLASKLIFQTSDGNFVGQNALTAIETGDILIHKVNEPLTQLANTSHDITSLQSFGVQWQSLGNQINGISEAMLGANQPAGSAWRQTEALLAESRSLFELMTENKGLAIERMLRKFILPFFKRNLKNNKELVATLSAYDLNFIDSRFVPKEAIKRGNKQMIDTVLRGEIAPQADFQALQGQVQGEMNQQGNKRTLSASDVSDKTWADAFKDLEWDLEVDITGESKDVQGAFETLNNALKVVVTPGFENNKKAQYVVDKILELSGTISPLELSALSGTPPQTQQNKVIESMSYKDLPFEGQQQMAQQAGIKITQPVAQTASKQQPVAMPQTVGAA